MKAVLATGSRYFKLLARLAEIGLGEQRELGSDSGNPPSNWAAISNYLPLAVGPPALPPRLPGH
jgi:hypothetical protein